MKMPHGQMAVVEREKVLDYLLNEAHPDNGGKASFFLGLGFTRENWEIFRAALQEAAELGSVTKMMESVHGIKYVIDARLTGPVGRQASVRTVWAVDAGTEQPRLVTAYPRKEQL